jgi:hypothetical protein
MIPPCINELVVTSIVLFDTVQRTNPLYFTCLLGDHMVGQNVLEVIVYMN